MTQKINFYNNSFTLVRYIAAFQVFMQHIITHFKLHNNLSFLSYIPGVPIFLCLSGFLIMNSLEKKISLSTYLKKRFIRIYPELWLCIAINAILLIIFNIEYIVNFMFWIFNIAQGTFLQFWTPDILRTYGVGSPNGSLWTITIFVQFYIIIYFLYPIINKMSKRANLIVLINSCLLNIIVGTLNGKIDPIIYKLICQTIIPYFSMFYVGIICYLYKDKLLKNKAYFYISFSLYLIISFIDLGQCIPNVYINCISSTLLGYIILNFGYLFPKLKIQKDLTFGIYIYHMIFINLFVEWSFMNNYIGCFMVLFITIVFAYFSNKFMLYINEIIKSRRKSYGN